MDRTSEWRAPSPGHVAAPRLLDVGGCPRRPTRKSRPAQPHTVDQLTVHALSCALRPECEQPDAVRSLLHIAGGNRSAVLRALRRVDEVGPGRPHTPAGQRAALLLRLTLAEGSWNWGARAV